MIREQHRHKLVTETVPSRTWPGKPVLNKHSTRNNFLHPVVASMSSKLDQQSLQWDRQEGQDGPREIRCTSDPSLFWWHSLASHLRSQSTAAHEMWRIGREPLRAPAESPSHGRHFGSFAAVARPIQHQDHHLRAEVHLESASSARLSEALRPKPWSRAVLCYPCWAERTWLQLGFNSSRRKAKKGKMESVFWASKNDKIALQCSRSNSSDTMENINKLAWNIENASKQVNHSCPIGMDSCRHIEGFTESSKPGPHSPQSMSTSKSSADFPQISGIAWRVQAILCKGCWENSLPLGTSNKNDRFAHSLQNICPCPMRPIREDCHPK